ncbi:hypothetical protein BSPLISOX_131 [uncultured Gammaproteobacteria bacterium]|jgi:hypothetical protein|nr:hypothetical protein [uncultured Gammaproteobacteria bacterium]VVH64741.1 hypothetical protein BSPLISOX_131 [uncultured Gammaproteobacteria bacterium]
MSRKELKLATIKRLYAKSGNQCSFPNCKQQFFSGNSTNNMSQVCHIEAAEKGGQRYNHNSTDELRRQYDNLILLCPTHHKTTDDIDKYPVEVLKSMKSEHENKMEERKVSDKPTIFVTAINALVNIEFSNEDDIDSFNNFSINDKIDHNQIARWKPRINEYKKYQGKVESIYNNLELAGESFKKDKLLQLIRHKYLTVQGKFLQESKKISNKSDGILDEIEKELINEVEIDYDDMVIAIPIIMVDAFMRCKILEKPNK